MHNHNSIQSCPSELNVLFIYGRIPSNMVGYRLFKKNFKQLLTLQSSDLGLIKVTHQRLFLFDYHWALWLDYSKISHVMVLRKEEWEDKRV